MENFHKQNTKKKQNPNDIKRRKNSASTHSVRCVSFRFKQCCVNSLSLDFYMYLSSRTHSIFTLSQTRRFFWLDI